MASAPAQKSNDFKVRFPDRHLDGGTAISYTQWEAWLALYHGKVLLIAKADDVAPRGPNFAHTDASRAAQQAHLARLQAVERYPGCRFTSPDNLANYILVSVILDLLVEERGLDQQTDPRRRQILAKVKRDWIDDCLDNSLHNLARVELGLEEKVDAVDRPLNTVVQ